ncbi:MAG TPA: DUF2807 domain-containing protein [Flavobacterium sp.]|jgi:hypothetical protein
MKRILFLVICVLVSGLTYAQKAKVKGSRNVTTEQREIGNFENLEVEDNLEIFLSKGDHCEIEIDADDNLHEAISITLDAGTLRISSTSDVTSSKKFSVKVTYTDDFKMIVAKDDTRITGLDDIQLDDFTIKASGSAKVYSNIKVKTFTLMGNDKSKTEINLTSDNATIELSKNSQLKALISSPSLKFDMYQKSAATIEGDINEMKLRLDNNATFTGRNLTAANADIVVEGSSNGSLAVTGNAIIEASGKSEIDLHGDQKKIEIRKFTDSASIRKRPLKA